MPNEIQRLQDYLAKVNEEAIVQARECIDRMLAQSHALGQEELSKRPHIAMPERRGGNRYPIQASGFCWNPLQNPMQTETKRPAHILDLSKTGCSLLCDAPVPPSQLLNLEFRPPHMETDQKVLLEVVRITKAADTDLGTYRLGCKTIDEEQVARAKQFLEHMAQVKACFANRQTLSLICLVDEPKNDPGPAFLKQQGFSVHTASSPEALPSLLSEMKFHALVCPARLLRLGPEGWLPLLRREYPGMAVVAHAASAAEKGEALLQGVDQCFLAGETQSQGALAVERAIYQRHPGLAPKPFLGPEKVLVAGRDEKQVRKTETLLLGRQFLVAQARTYSELMEELDAQRFDILIAAAEFFRHGEFAEIADLRAKQPALVIIIQTANSDDAAMALGKGADLPLAPDFSRASLVECLEEAKLRLATRTFRQS